MQELRTTGEQVRENSTHAAPYLDVGLPQRHGQEVAHSLLVEGADGVHVLYAAGACNLVL